MECRKQKEKEFWEKHDKERKEREERMKNRNKSYK